MIVRRLALALVALLLLAACGGDEAATDEAVAATEPAAAEATEPAADETSEPAEAMTEGEDGAATDGVTLETSESDLGEIVVDSEGMTLYVFDNDSEGTSTCTGDCAANWPPLTGEATAGEGIDESLIGSTERDDGTMQVTFDGLPLYYFAADQAAGDTNGQAVGDVWWVVAPDGEKITEEAVSQADTSNALGY